ncbi:MULTISPECIES: hypothetical protein [Haloferax]|uniref:Uncharacterized protein n=2 Tax=Haloferax TaxID=2251 RepID=A0A6G1YXV7_9EURY|nr:MULTISPECIES: hypothetical protein [Haloferax]KAB1186610.1 hypothetical protein Hfx1149_00595 [Haloferax sp. CBA1149]MRW79227.1 hypothetical protein [Haloferax marinisediminis]
MNSRADTTDVASESSPTTTRRRLLAASGSLGVAGLSGCLGRVARATTNTGAAPALYYTGDASSEDTVTDGDGTARVYGVGHADIRHIPSTVSGGSGLLSAEIELDGWATSTSTKAQDYNSSRSNKPRTRRGDDDSDDDGLPDGKEELYEYLDGEPTIGERFTVSLPDARLPGNRGAVADELTPQRLLDYFTGEPNSDRCAENANSRALLVHRDIACRNLLSATLEEDKSKTRKVAVFTTSGGVVVTGATPEAKQAERMVLVSEDGTASTLETLDSWGDERVTGAVGVTPTLVCPMSVTPADCPSPMPALFYVRRIRHDDQYLYTGGWVVDDGALYENTATLLVGEAPNEVIGLTPSDIERSATELRSIIRRRRRGRSAKDATVLLSRYDAEADTLPDGVHSVCGTDGGGYWRVQSKEALASGTGDCDDTDPSPTPTSVVTALDAPILHLVETSELSNEVKFKAGAELSKAVN